MKNTIILATFFSIILSGCGGDNSFESAFNPYTGSKEKADKWRDQGGLDKQNKFHGVSVTNISYRFQNNGMLDNVEMKVEGATSPEDMRKALGRACKAKDSDFSRVPNFPRGSVRMYPQGSDPVLGTIYKLACIYEGDTKKLYISSSLTTATPNQALKKQLDVV